MSKELVIKTQIAENENYTLNVVRPPDVDLDVYGCINKQFGVLEMSTSVLANARKFFTMLDSWERNPNSDDLPDLPVGGMN